jgi:hypothetical protein
MNATKLAQQAIDATKASAAFVSPEIRYQLAQAQIAKWLTIQDEDHLAAATQTFLAAMACLGALLPA